MNHPSSWHTRWGVSLHREHQFCVRLLSPLDIYVEFILLWYDYERCSLWMIGFRLPSYHSRLCNLYHAPHPILVSVFVFCPDSMHQTPYHRIQCLCTMHFHHCIILWIFRRTWKQPHHLITPVIGWQESRHYCNLQFEFYSQFQYYLQAHTVFSLVPMGLINNPNTPCTERELAVASRIRCGY